MVRGRGKPRPYKFASRMPFGALFVEDDEEDDPFEVFEVVVRTSGDESGAALLERKHLVLHPQRPASFEDEIELVPFVRFLAVGVRRGEEVDADLDSRRLVDDLVPAGSESLDDAAVVESVAVQHSRRRVNVAAVAVARPRPRPEEDVSGVLYWISVSSLNMGRYIEMMITPTTSPTPIIIRGSMTEVRVAIEVSTSSS
jgi:hypothetical protein